MIMWSKLDALVDASTDLAGLQAHGLDLYAARRWRLTGRDIPDDFRAHERAATMASLAVPSLLAQIRDVLDRPMLLMKGPEVAALYPDATLRPYCDLDLLVRDADTSHRRLVAAGWEEISDGVSHHHPALRSPDSMLLLEIHTRPNGPSWTTAHIDELFSSAVPTALAVDGVQTLSPAHHAVLLAAHSWQHEPFRRLLDLIDVAVMSEKVDASVLERTAQQWGLSSVWRATTLAIDALLGEESTAPVVDYMMTGHCRQLRERSVLESRLACWIAGFWAPTPTAKVRALATTVNKDLRPFPGESWTRKVQRTGTVLRHTFSPNSDCPRI